MQSQEWLESKTYGIGDRMVFLSDALIAVEMSRMEGLIDALEASMKEDAAMRMKYKLKEFKIKNNIPL